MPTISQAVTEGSSRLKSSGVDRDRRTAGLLLCHLLGVDRTYLFTRSAELIDDACYHSYLSLIERRASGEPVQYITGHQEFYGLDFVVTPDVLIPRPETEFLVERVIKILGESPEESPLIVDLATGSGCIAVALAVHIPRARVIATDISRAGLEVAKRNAERNSVGTRIEFREGDLLTPLDKGSLAGAVDVLASNPPYVNEGVSELVQPEVRDWEPKQALFGGPDGLLFYRRLLSEGFNYLKPGGSMVLEIGYGQFDSITSLIAESGLELVEVTRDLQHIPRTISIRKTSSETS